MHFTPLNKHTCIFICADAHKETHAHKSLEHTYTCQEKHRLWCKHYLMLALPCKTLSRTCLWACSSFFHRTGIHPQRLYVLFMSFNIHKKRCTVLYLCCWWLNVLLEEKFKKKHWSVAAKCTHSPNMCGRADHCAHTQARMCWRAKSDPAQTNFDTPQRI